LDYSLDNGSTWEYLTNYTSGFASSMSTKWLVPNVSSSQCKIRITVQDINGRYYSDYSDATFTIVQAPLPHITYPNGGETLIGGSIYSVQWTIANPSVVSGISLDYSLDNGSTWEYLTNYTSGFASSMSTNWLVPNVSSSQCKIRITVQDINGRYYSDYSDAAFTIVQAP
jgi:hypothetical protein